MAVDTPNKGEVQDREKREDEILKAEAEQLKKYTQSQGSIRWNLLRMLVIILTGMGCVYALYQWPIGLTALLGALTLLLVIWMSEYSAVKDRLPAGKKGVVITGCDTGFGHLLARHLDCIGVTVFAGCLNAEGDGARTLREEGSARMHVVQMDVTKYDQIQECVQYVKKNIGNGVLWGVVNNAGLNFLGDVELTTVEQYERVTNINMLGMVRVTKAFLPMIRQSKGRFVNVTSVKGRFAEPINAAYGMTKFAVECFSDVLRLEMKKFGVSVSIIEPGNFGGATSCLDPQRIKADYDSMWETADDGVKQTYGREYIEDQLRHIQRAGPTACFDLNPVVEAMTDGLLGYKPKYRYLVPGGAGLYDIYKWRILVYPFLPTWMMDRWLLSDHTQELPPQAVRM